MIFPILSLLFNPSHISVQRLPNGAYTYSRAGRPFWSFGVDCVDVGLKPTEVKADNPGYSALNHYKTEKDWSIATLAQLRFWGFNTLGGWSDVDTLKKYGGTNMLPYTVVLHLGSYDMAPWHDLFAPAMAKAIDGAAKKQIPEYRNDPNLLGYFTDNELGWWDDTLFLAYLKFPNEAPGHQALITLLKHRYRSLASLKKEWRTSATRFDNLHEMKLRPGTKGRQMVKAWAFTAATQYYKLVHDAIRRYDSSHLILGDRYCQYYTLPVVQASAPYVDVISTNYGADWNDGSISNFYLGTLRAASGHPIQIGEFYMASKENRSHDRNTQGGFPTVDTQSERAIAFRHYLKSVKARPFVVGAHWFQFYDEPGKGRGDGENYDMGLIDVDGQSYTEMTDQSKSFSTAPRPALPMGRGKAIPQAIFHPMEDLKGWDRIRGFVKPRSSLPLADLYLSWSKDGLYVGLFSMDYSDASLYGTKEVPLQDQSRFQLNVGGAKLDLRFFSTKPRGLETLPNGVLVRELPNLRGTLIAFIPAKLLPAKSLQHGKTLALIGSVVNHGNVEQTEWRSHITLD